MENLLDVVRERDTAAALLETGEPPLAGRRRWAYNALGIGYWRKCVEYRVPVHMNNTLRRAGALGGTWQHRYIRLRREAALRRRRAEIAREVGVAAGRAEAFPGNADAAPNLERFGRTMAATAMGKAKE
jgi:hypothetical protein